MLVCRRSRWGKAPDGEDAEHVLLPQLLQPVPEGRFDPDAELRRGGLRRGDRLVRQAQSRYRQDVKYCKRCGQPLDFHALLQGKLDYHAWGPSWAALAFLLMLAASWFWLGHSFWASLGLAALAATAAGFAGSWLERKRLARWRLNERELAKLTVP